MVKNGLISAVGVALGLGMAVARAAPGSAVLGLTDAAPAADGLELTATATATPRNHGELVSGVARSNHATATPTSTPTPTEAVDATGTPTATPETTGSPTATPEASATPSATPEATVTPTATAEPTETPTDEDASEASDSWRNHGAYVSSVAHLAPKGPGHGEIVSAAARSDVGKKGGDSGAPVDEDADVDDGNGDEDGDELLTTTGTPTATPVDTAAKAAKGPKVKKGRP